jgi:hypothetical protein
MCNYLRLVQLFVWGVFAACGGDSADANEQASWGSHIDNAMQSWSHLLASSGPTEYAALVTSEGKDDAYHREYEFHLKRRGDCVVYISRERLTEPNGEEQGEHYTCYGRNSDYSFALTRSRVEDPWSLRRLVVDPEDPDVAYFDTYLHILVGSIDMKALLVQDELISRLLAAPNCTVLRCDAVKHEGGRLLEVEFEYDAAKDEKNVLGLPARSMHATVLLDPSHSYVVREATTVLPASGSERHDVYDVVPEHGQIMRSRTGEWTSAGKRYSEVQDVLLACLNRRGTNHVGVTLLGLWAFSRCSSWLGGCGYFTGAVKWV